MVLDCFSEDSGTGMREVGACPLPDLVGRAGDLALSQATRVVWGTSVNGENSDTKLSPTALGCCKFH